VIVLQYATFKVGENTFGVDVRVVQEVLRPHPITRVPLAPAAIAGLINLRGQVVTAVDMRQRLGLPPNDGERESMNVVARLGDGVVSLLVDSIGDVIEVDDADFEAPPETLTGPSRGLVLGAYKLDSTLLLALDVIRVADIDVAA
jgi:purine-binding chemotaxis protein CheW